MNPTPPESRSSKKTIIIVVIAGVALLLLVTAIVTVAIFIYIFTSGPMNRSAREFPPPASNTQKTNTSPANTATDNDGKTKSLIEVLKEKPIIGGYSLQNIIPQYSEKKYNNAAAEVKAIYTANGKSVSFVVAQYADRSRSTLEFGRMLGTEKANGAKITVPLRVRGNTIYAEFESGPTSNIAFCIWPKDSPVQCHVIGSDDKQALADFREGLVSNS